MLAFAKMLDAILGAMAVRSEILSAAWIQVLQKEMKLSDERIKTLYLKTPSSQETLENMNKRRDAIKQVMNIAGCE